MSISMTTSLPPAVMIHEACFRPYHELETAEQCIYQAFKGQVGASANFIGTMRDVNEGEAVQSMHLEHYPGMTEKVLANICQQVIEKYRCHYAMIHHRVGKITINEPIVLVAAWSAHRAEAFAACQAMMESLKADAPFWKQETLSDQEQRWVSDNTSGVFVP